MDLLAYTQIEDLEVILKENGIDIPRLRGIDLCSEMSPFTEEEIQKTLSRIEIECCEDLCTSYPFWNPNSDSSEFSERTDYLEDFFMKKEKYETCDFYIHTSIRWERIHGWKRKVLKTYIHNCKKEFLEYVKKWNYYCGKENIIRVHSRMGGYNWTYDDPDWIKRRTEIVNAPWFIEKVDNYWDTTYCDIYCKIK